MNASLLIFVSFVFLAACEGCSTSVREAAEAARTARAAIAIGNERVRINGLGIGSSEAQVLNALGRPQTATDGFSEVEVSPREMSRSLLKM